MKYFLFLLKTSLEDLRRNKVRTFLTSLGILIGVLSVILLMAFGFGLKGFIDKQFESLGKNLIMVLPGTGFKGGGQGLIGGVQFDEKDVSKLERIKNIDELAPVFTKSLKIEAEGKSEATTLVGSTVNIFKISSLELDYGRPFSETDLQKKKKVVVIGSKIAEKLFGTNSNAIGKTVRIQNHRFIVIGTLKKKGGGAIGSDVDAHSMAPYTSLTSLNPNKTFFGIYLKTINDQTVPEVKAEIKKVLLKRYKADDFSISEQAELLEMINTIFGVLNTALIAIGSISLVVGGIGIMNIMYATVTERTKEVGIRRAVGATEEDILKQFLTESLLLSLFGGVFGLILASLIVLGVRAFFPASINLLAVIIAFVVSSAIGVFFGVFPARRAAKLPPIEAIRYE